MCIDPRITDTFTVPHSSLHCASRTSHLHLALIVATSQNHLRALPPPSEPPTSHRNRPHSTQRNPLTGVTYVASLLQLVLSQFLSIKYSVESHRMTHPPIPSCTGWLYAHALAETAHTPQLVSRLRQAQPGPPHAGLSRCSSRGRKYILKHSRSCSKVA